MASLALAQSDERAAFVANNGNVEGSVTAFTFNPDGSPHLVMELNTSTNPQTIAITPNGQYLATGHGTSSVNTEALTIIEIAADASLSIVEVFQVPDSPLDVEWISDNLLAVTRTQLGSQNRVDIYRFDPAGPSLTVVDMQNTDDFTVYLAVHPSRRFIYAADSGLSSAGNYIYAFEVNPDGTLALVDVEDTGSTYPLGMAVSHDGTKLYSTGGISSGGNAVIGFNVQSDGSLTPMLGSPFASPGQSPKDVTFSSDDAYLFVGHGTDATVRSMAIDQESGALTYTGFSFDVGLQGTLGDLEVVEDLLLVTDESTAIDGVRGLYSFAVQPNGNFIQTGPIVDSLGVTPESIAVWSPPRNLGDMNCDGALDGADIDPFFLALGFPDQYAQQFPDCEILNGDINGDDAVDGADIEPFFDLLGG